MTDIEICQRDMLYTFRRQCRRHPDLRPMTAARNLPRTTAMTIEIFISDRPNPALAQCPAWPAIWPPRPRSSPIKLSDRRHTPDRRRKRCAHERSCGFDARTNSRGHRGRFAPLWAGEGHGGGRCPCARCQPRQRLPAFPEQGFAARGGGQALARPRQRAAAEDRGRLRAGAGAARALAARAVRDQAEEGLRRPRDVRDLSDAGARGLRGR